MTRGSGRKYNYENPKPSKACTPFNFYVQENYHYFRRWLNDRDPHAVLHELANQWKNNTTPEEKVYYANLAKQDKIRAENEKQEYERQLLEGIIKEPPRRPRVTDKPGYPRLTTNSFLQFANANRAQVTTPGLTSREVMQVLAKQWRQLGAKEKKPYQRQTRIDSVRYRGAKQQFRNEEKVRRQQQRVASNRERLNLIFHSKIPPARNAVPVREE